MLRQCEEDEQLNPSSVYISVTTDIDTVLLAWWEGRYICINANLDTGHMHVIGYTNAQKISSVINILRKLNYEVMAMSEIVDEEQKMGCVKDIRDMMINFKDIKIPIVMDT